MPLKTLARRAPCAGAMLCAALLNLPAIAQTPKAPAPGAAPVQAQTQQPAAPQTAPSTPPRSAGNDAALMLDRLCA